TGDYDLIGGLAGIGVYALARGKAGVPLATAVVAKLVQLSRPRRGGLAWHTPPAHLAPWQRTEAPRGCWNLGLSHGTAGVIALLARLASAEIPAARALLDAAMISLTSIAGPSGARFPAWLAGGPDEPDAVGAASSRLAWCYNDLGVAIAMLAAGRATRNAAWTADALALARECAGRHGARAKLDDAGLCHGYFGAAHLFNRLRHATGEACFIEAAQRWLAHGLATRTDRPVAGFPRKIGDGPDDWMADASLLTGAAGVALALHAAISEVEPSWDQLLLVDLAAP
ncbi:MAG TPA: lanthionine synthetase LanC family protein, partial [Kofleriaceae bacterium]